MKRGRVRKQPLGIQLFPFLAVLICTMGALIALLVMQVQQARLDAASVAVETQSRANQDMGKAQEALQLEQEEHEWRREEFERQRGEKVKELGSQRLELSHLEDHIRRLEDRYRQLTEAAKELAKAGQGRDADLWGARQELEQLRALTDQTRKALEAAKSESAGRQPGFAIIPYDGPNGTQRRPIYIECRQDGIVIHPEGIVLSAEDFNGPLGPGNPLDASLRTIREHLARQGNVAGQGEPYPLLIVRPDGAVAYAVARAAMKTWEDEFGYELIDADMQLAFPKPDPELARLLEKTIRDARQRQAILAAAMPSEYEAPPAAGLVASSQTGGFVMTGGGSDQDWGMGGGTSPGGRSYAAPTLSGGRNPVGRVGSFQDLERASSANDVFLTGNGDPSAGTSGSRPTGRRAGETGGSGGSADAQGNDEAVAGPNGQLPGAQYVSHGSTGGSASQGSARPGGTASGSNAGTGGSRSGGKAQGGGKQRRSNWGLPESTQTLTGITRPVQIQCGPNVLAVVPERGERGARRREVPVPGAMDDVIDDFVAAVWKHVDGWGIAVAGGYWKPVLDVQVLPGGEDRFQELQTLMENSGLHVRRKGP